MWVIKLEGSLIGTPELSKWLDVVERNGDGKVVIVPGGGFLADAIRDVQKRAYLNDETAHRMAVLSMDQYGLLMLGTNPKLVGAKSELEIAERGWQHRGIVWFPSNMVHADTEIPMNKHMTSDSLAAWLASKLDVSHVVIVKSVEHTHTQANVQDLAQSGMLDAFFYRYLCANNPNGGFNTWLLDKQHHHLFNESFDVQKLAQHAIAVVK